LSYSFHLKELLCHNTRVPWFQLKEERYTHESVANQMDDWQPQTTFNFDSIPAAATTQHSLAFSLLCRAHIVWYLYLNQRCFSTEIFLIPLHFLTLFCISFYHIVYSSIHMICSCYRIIFIYFCRFLLQLSTIIFHFLLFTFLWCVSIKCGNTVMLQFKFGSWYTFINKIVWILAFYLWSKTGIWCWYLC